MRSSSTVASGKWRVASFFVALITCLLPLSLWAQTISLVQHTSSNSGSSSVSTQATAFGTNPVQNNLLVAGGGNASGGTISSCSDTLLNTWTVVQTVANGTNTNSGICWALQTHTSGADTVTLNDTTAGVQFMCAIAEYSSSTGWPATPTDAGNVGTGTSTSVATASFTTTGTDVIFAVEKLVGHSGETITAGSGYTLLDVQPATASKAGDEDELNASAGSYTGTFTDSNTDAGWSVSAEGFKATASSGGPPHQLPTLGVGR